MQFIWVLPVSNRRRVWQAGVCSEYIYQTAHGCDYSGMHNAEDVHGTNSTNNKLIVIRRGRQNRVEVCVPFVSPNKGCSSHQGCKMWTHLLCYKFQSDGELVSVSEPKAPFNPLCSPFDASTLFYIHESQLLLSHWKPLCSSLETILSDFSESLA